MKGFNRLIFTVLLLFAASFLVSARLEAQEQKTDTSSVWKVRIVSDGAESRGTEYSIEGCRVFFPESRKPLIQIIAIDLNWNGKKLEQVINIEVDKGRVKKRDQRYIFLIYGKHGFYQKTKGYDVFSVKYGGRALNLPPEIRELFHGLYGIGKPDF